MVSESARSLNVLGRRMRSRREALGWSLEKVGVAIGIDESSSRARISRYELGVHEPPVPTARLIAEVLGVPLAYLYCEDDSTAVLLTELHQLTSRERETRVRSFLAMLAGSVGTNKQASSAG